MVAGFSENSPFTHNLNIVLRGSLDPNDPDNEDMPMPYGIPNVGWKAIGESGMSMSSGIPKVGGKAIGQSVMPMPIGI